MRDGAVVGYAEMTTAFFHRPFIGLLSVRAKHRRQGIATALMKALEAKCREEKLFTSTNDSNSAMQALLAKLGYRRCGSIEELDEGGPELIFVKFLTRSP
jgi:ribosomal protein S18 acetylase RimI-like enzyme